ncbi:MAG TPA: amidase family protein, partial [Candidatus Cybelea sp.]|nr:amidase family protein [Candidatus Cybelea sp.]
TDLTIANRAEQLGRTPRPDDVERSTWAIAEFGRQTSASDYARSVQTMHRVGRAIGRFFTRYDILLTPTMCKPPHKLGILGPDNADADAYLDALLGTIAFTSPFNSSGNPAMSVPLHWSRSGLPIGVQFVAPFGDEARLFRLASQLEKAAPWAERRPKLH